MRKVGAEVAQSLKFHRYYSTNPNRIGSTCGSSYSIPLSFSLIGLLLLVGIGFSLLRFITRRQRGKRRAPGRRFVKCLASAPDDITAADLPKLWGCQPGRLPDGHPKPISLASASSRSAVAEPSSRPNRDYIGNCTGDRYFEPIRDDWKV
jgi:hypothetical protein